MRGTIKILDSSGEPANVKPFEDKGYNTIANIKARWKRMYGKAYKEDRIVIEVDRKVSEYDRIELVEDSRPEAVYSNPKFNS